MWLDLFLGVVVAACRWAMGLQPIYMPTPNLLVLLGKLNSGLVSMSVMAL